MCEVKITNAENAEYIMLQACMIKIATHIIDQYPDVMRAEIACQDRVPDDAPAYKHPGWLEYVITYRYSSARTSELHAIQRTSGADEVEFYE